MARTNWLDFEVSSWRDFVNKAADIVEAVGHGTSLLCRGQADSAWPLRPSLLRAFRRPSQAWVIEVERSALASYKPEAYGLLPPTKLPEKESDVLDWWMKMQHYGAPTRLLDWTASPYVAAYFAVKECPTKDGVIWFVDLKKLNEEMGVTEEEVKEIKADEASFYQRIGNRERLHIINDSRPMERMIAQSGLFTVSERVTSDHGDVIHRALAGKGKSGITHGRLKVPSRCKDLFLLHLHAMNVKASTLFPGIDGVGASISEIVHMQRRVVTHRRPHWYHSAGALTV